MIKVLDKTKPIYLYLIALAFTLLSKVFEKDDITLSYLLTGIGLVFFIIALRKHFKNR